MNQHHPMEALARELREGLASGAFAHRGRVDLSDGVSVDPMRMARIVLADFERITRDAREDWLTASEQEALYDDMLRLLTFAR